MNTRAFAAAALGGLTLLSRAAAQPDCDHLFGEFLIETPVDLTGLAAGDVDNDGQTDLVLSERADPGTVSLRLGTGGGRFGDRTSMPVDFVPRAALLEDLNGDATLDLIVPSWDPDIGLAIWLGQGDGTFTDRRDIVTGEWYPFITIADFNEDGTPDLAVVPYPSGGVEIMHGAGDGSFAPGGCFGAGVFAEAMVTGDFDGDGHLDLALANPAYDIVSVLPGAGDGTFGFARITFVDPHLLRLDAGDLDGDGTLDLVGGSGGPLTTLIGTGDGFFQIGPVLDPILDGPLQAVVVHDVNADDRADVIMVTRGSDFHPEAARIAVFAAGEDGAFGPASYHGAQGEVDSVLVHDLDDDGRPDIATTNPYEGPVHVRLNSRDGIFGFDYPLDLPTTAINVADVDGDGRGDLIATQLSWPSGPERDVMILRNLGEGDFGDPMTYGNEPGFHAVTVTDFDGDATVDLAITSDENDEVSVHRGLGDGTFSESDRQPIGSDPIAVVAADFDGNGAPDIAVANRDSEDVSILLGAGDGTFVSHDPAPLGFTPRELAAADFNGDGASDLVVVGNGAAVLVGKGDGSFVKGVPLAASAMTIGVDVGDLNGDGAVDIVTVEYATSEALSIWFNNGDGSFPPLAVTYATGRFSVDVHIADIDGDGALDVVSGGYPHGHLTHGDITVMLGLGDGTLAGPVRYHGGLLPRDITSADLDGDGSLDLAAAMSLIHGYDYALSVVLNRCDVCAADLDGSGAVDFTDLLTVVVSWGACPSSCPADIDGSGAVDLLDLAAIVRAWGPCSS